VPNGFEAAQLLLEHGANVHVRGNCGETPRQDASKGYERLNRAFLNPSIDPQGWTLLHAISDRGLPIAVQRLLEDGANPEARDSKGQTPLHASVKGLEPHFYDNYIEVIRVLLSHGADVNAQDMDHSTPLHLIAARGGLEITRLLLDHGADPNLRNSQGKVPGDIAAEKSPKSLTTRLLSERTLERETVLTLTA
jgi:ankyrin repeat protein